MVIACGLLVAGLGSGVSAQQAARPAPMRPPLFFSETWRPLPTPADDHGAWPASQGGVGDWQTTLWSKTHCPEPLQ